MAQLHRHVQRVGGRSSKSREAVARGALTMRGHFRAEDLASAVPEVNLATIYRVLPVLLEAGLLKQAPGRSDGQRYERAFESGQHSHLVCVSCDQIIEVENELLEPLKREVAERFSFVIETEHIHQLNGKCRLCRRSSQRG